MTLKRLGFAKRQTLNEERRRKFWDVLDYINRVIAPTSAIDTEQAWINLLDHLNPARPYLGIIRALFLTQTEYSPLVDKLRTLHPEIDEYIQVWCSPIQS